MMHWMIKEVDGILIANSLHYVKDKETLLKKLISSMKTNGVFLIVEYDRQAGNQWVPYPLTIDAAKALFKSLGYSGFHVLNKRPSVFGGYYMYAAITGRKRGEQRTATWRSAEIVNRQS